MPDLAPWPRTCTCFVPGPLHFPEDSFSYQAVAHKRRCNEGKARAMRGACQKTSRCAAVGAAQISCSPPRPPSTSPGRMAELPSSASFIQLRLGAPWAPLHVVLTVPRQRKIVTQSLGNRPSSSPCKQKGPSSQSEPSRGMHWKGSQ